MAAEDRKEIITKDGVMLEVIEAGEDTSIPPEWKGKRKDGSRRLLTMERVLLFFESAFIAYLLVQNYELANKGAEPTAIVREPTAIVLSNTPTSSPTTTESQSQTSTPDIISGILSTFRENWSEKPQVLEEFLASQKTALKSIAILQALHDNPGLYIPGVNRDDDTSIYFFGYTGNRSDWAKNPLKIPLPYFLWQFYERVEQMPNTDRNTLLWFTNRFQNYLAHLVNLNRPYTQELILYPYTPKQKQTEDEAFENFANYVEFMCSGEHIIAGPCVNERIVLADAYAQLVNAFQALPRATQVSIQGTFGQSFSDLTNETWANAYQQAGQSLFGTENTNLSDILDIVPFLNTGN